MRNISVLHPGCPPSRTSLVLDWLDLKSNAPRLLCLPPLFRGKRMRRADLEGVAAQMVAAAQGILAADESSGTIKKRFDKIGLESTEESRRTYRDVLLTTRDMAKSISGVIFYDETLRQKTSSGVPFGAYLGQLGVLPGIKVDMGAKALAAFPNETITEGLDGLRERLVEYYGLGARFAKWRGPVHNRAGIPPFLPLHTPPPAPARFAAPCPEQKNLPIAETGELLDG